MGMFTRGGEKLAGQKRERRVRALCVGVDTILEMLSPSASQRVGYTAPGLPADWEPEGVHFDWLRNSFVFMIYSETFDPVPEGEQVPWIEDGVRGEYRVPIEGPDQLTHWGDNAVTTSDGVATAADPACKCDIPQLSYKDW